MLVTFCKYDKLFTLRDSADPRESRIDPWSDQQGFAQRRWSFSEGPFGYSAGFFRESDAKKGCFVRTTARKLWKIEECDDHGVFAVRTSIRTNQTNLSTKCPENVMQQWWTNYWKFHQQIDHRIDAERASLGNPKVWTARWAGVWRGRTFKDEVHESITFQWQRNDPRAWGALI